jgi:ribosomal protein L37E
MTCPSCGSDKVENKETGECASCGSARRKAERRKVVVKKPLKKVSDKKQNDIDQYAVLRQAFLLRKWCAVHGKPCLPDQVHHQKGKVGFCDDIARDKGIPALLDIRYWIPVCHEAHDWITEHSNEAIEQGISFKRTV